MKKIILILFFILLCLLLVILNVLNNLKLKENSQNSIIGKQNINNNINQNLITIDTEIMSSNKEFTTVKEVIEYYDSKYIKREKNLFITTYVNFKFDLFDEEGNSNKDYFYDIIKAIVKLEKDNFYLIDNEKKIEIFVSYNKEKETYKIKINQIDDYYSEIDGKTFKDLKNSKIVNKSNFIIKNSLLTILGQNNLYYSITELASNEREELENGYFSYSDGKILARLKSGRVLNLIFRKGYEEEIADGIYVGTDLADIIDKYSNISFGGLQEGYLGYRTDYFYVFIYDDEISIYGYQYSPNNYFDEYIENYCKTSDLEQLHKDFTTKWTNYFEDEYNFEEQKLKVTFPTRGISIDITNNDSKGITIYNNYYLTETIRNLIKDNKITLETDKDYIFEVEKERRKKSN